MAKKVSRRLVIDASVARSCGKENATSPTSKNCRDFLKAVLDICHQAVMTPDMVEEWDKHQSSFARRWRVSMVARKKIYFPDNITTADELWEKIESIADSDKECEAMLKDFRLIEAALITDNTIISLDETVRQLFDKVSMRVGELRNIVWVNPDRVEEEQPLDWLENGAAPCYTRIIAS